MTKIEKLPKEIEDRLLEIRDEWIAYGLSTEPSDRPRAERAVDMAYKAADLAALERLPTHRIKTGASTQDERNALEDSISKGSQRNVMTKKVRA